MKTRPMRPNEVDPEREQVDVQQRLHAGHRPHPAGRSQGVLAEFHAGELCATQRVKSSPREPVMAYAASHA
jgi:hypothetical protein